MPSIGLNAPGEALCDFCGEQLADNSGAGYFPARLFEIRHPLMAGPIISGDRWYACGDCRPLVQAADWAALAQRTGLPAGIVVPSWKAFAAHRDGPPVDVPDVAAAEAEERDRKAAREQES